MQKEHVPYPEPRGDFQLRLDGLDDEQEQSSHYFVLPDKWQTHLDKVKELDKKGDNGIFGLMRQAQDNIDQALGLDGDLKLKDGVLES